MSLRLVIGDAVLIHGDCNERLPMLLTADIVFGDPPYGINYRVNARPPRRSLPGVLGETATASKPPIRGDDEPFDPSPWLEADRLALFGANHFKHRLPEGGKWVVWDKRVGMTRDSHSDCEFVWINRNGADRIHRQKWRGICREGEENCARSKKLHTNQKPVALCAYVLEQLGAEPGMTIADPWMGSGSLLVAGLRLGLKVIGCEIDRQHFDTAVTRVRAEQRQELPS